MRWKAFALARTSDEIDVRSHEFRNNPSADNWMHLEKAMKAHQKAKFLPEHDLKTLLKYVCSGDDGEQDAVITVLSKRFDLDMEFLHYACKIGHVRLIKADELIAA